jgi:hypothetical protein
MIRFIWYLKEDYHTQHVGDGVVVNSIIVLKYLATKVLELARNANIDKESRIIPCHI